MLSRGTIRFLWREHRLLFLAFAVALALAVLFAGRTTVYYIYWANHRDAPLQGWMTIGYVAHSYSVDRDELRQALGLDSPDRDRRTLTQVAAQRGIPISQLIAEIEAAIAAARTRDE